MARKYACIMATLGMTLVLLRAAKRGGGLESTLITALFWMILLGTIGLLVGAIARSTVEESVRQRMLRELTAQSGNRENIAIDNQIPA